MSKLKHLAIIMDGNRRWARLRGLSLIQGHQKVVNERLGELIESAIKRGIEFLTLWAFSTENWHRSVEEVNDLMNLFRQSLKQHLQDIVDRGARLLVIGDLSRFDLDIQEGIKRAIALSAENNKITVVVAINYGGRDEILRAVNKLRQTVAQQEPITEELFASFLDTANIPDPDMIIRTGGEKRLSGFLPWQSEYAELFFVDTLMPDFGVLELEQAINEYENRSRRFGR